MDPIRDVIWLSIGTPAERLQALASGRVDAADLSYPTDAQAQRMGYRVLWDARKEVVYPSMSVVTRRKTVQEDRDTVMRMLKSHIEGIAYFKTHKEFSMKVLSKYLRTNDQELLEGSYAIFKAGFHFHALSDHEGTGGHLRLCRGRRRPEIRGRKPEEFMDPSLVAELDKSGFIKKLYEQK